MPPYAYAILAVGWIFWITPFILTRRSTGSAAIVDRRARWGMLLIAIAYSLLWQGSFWAAPPAAWRTATSILFFVLAGILSLTSTRALGRQWRVDAGLNSDHQLVQSGPYRFLRHPIYASVLSEWLATALILSTPVLLLLPSIVLLALGTEIRVRIEDSLLASRFGDHFLAYQRSVSAYIPFLR